MEWDHRGLLEFAAPDTYRGVQEELLKKHLRYAAANSPFYRELFGRCGVDPAEVTLANLHELPMTDKEMFCTNHADFLAMPRAGIVDISLTSGTSGQVTPMMYSDNDLHRLAYNEEISFMGCGMTADDVVLLTCTLDRCFVAGLAYYSGARKRGASIIRNGLSSVESHLEIIRCLKPTILIGVPTFLLKLGQYLLTQGIEPARTGVKKLVCIGEPIRDRDLSFLKVGELLEQIWGAPIYSTYASTETITSFCECTAQQGGHLHPELAVVEIVNEGGALLPAGEIGEVVVTPLAMEGMPLVRFKTGDMSFLMEDPCSCGRFSPRLGPVLGRKNQLIKLRGTSFYPSAIYSALDSIPEISIYYIVTTNDYDLSDKVCIHVAVKDPSCSASLIGERLQARLRVLPEVIIESEGEIMNQLTAGNSRKLNRFVDKRTTS
jgi:phenylacetate-CoA ligase